jgi:2-oxoglutarate dehydrogenase complex dehydrogenase (E1) component-like enzyme
MSRRRRRRIEDLSSTFLHIIEASLTKVNRSREPQNMGAWTFVQPRFNKLLRAQHDDRCIEVGYVGRVPSASPATGSAKVHAAEQERIVNETLSVG